MHTIKDFPSAPFTARELKRLGISRKALDNAVRARVVRRVLHGVYLRADVTDTIETRCAAAKLVISEHSVVCDRTAAWLHGINVLAFHELEILPPIETYVLRGHATARCGGCDGGSRDLIPGDVMVIDGLAATTPIRTVLDLACKLSARDGLAALDMFMRVFGITRVELARLLVRYFRRRGVVQARVLVALADPRSESFGESWTRYEILTHGLPAPQPQFWIEVDGVPTYRLDLAYPKHRVAIEYDGQEFHTSTAKRERDRRRRNWLRDHGWIVIVVTHDMLTAEAVDAWIAEIRAALASRNFRASRRGVSRISTGNIPPLNELGGASVRRP